MGYGNVVVSVGAATLILVGNQNRKSLIITNEGSTKIYIGPDSSVTSDTAISIPATGMFTEDSGSETMYKGDVYGVSVTNSNTVRYWERT